MNFLMKTNFFNILYKYSNVLFKIYINKFLLMEEKVIMLKKKIIRINPINEIYISRKRKKKNIKKFYYTRALKLFNDQGYKKIYLCGIGACVNEAIKISLFIKEAMPSIEIGEIITETINHFDEFVNEETKERIQVREDRKSNKIKIELIKK